jgi:hypothetical protein
MLDYCRKTLDIDIASSIKATDVMWQITCGLAYLQRHKIDEGRLKLKNVFFWKRNLKSKRVVVKLTGYGYNYHKCEVSYYTYKHKYAVNPFKSVITEPKSQKRGRLISLLNSAACFTRLRLKKKPSQMHPSLSTV